MLHIEGTNNTTAQGAGWRTWMGTGVFIKENSDAMYIGMKQEPNIGGNRSDAVINWSDDATPSQGPDNLRFIFTQAAFGNGTCSNCPTTATGLNGREIARMTPQGNFGVGPLFTNLNVPKSQMGIQVSG